MAKCEYLNLLGNQAICEIVEETLGDAWWADEHNISCYNKKIACNVKNDYEREVNKSKKLQDSKCGVI